MKKKLRYFQAEAITAITTQWRQDHLSRPYVNLFTALGKSLVVADIMARVVGKNKRVVCLVPRMELVSQNYQEAFEYFDDEDKGKLGICCNKLGKMQTNKSAIVAMYQSIASKRNLKALGKIDVLLIDEAHYVSSDEKSVLRRVVAYLTSINHKIYIAGLTATHYRVGEGMLHEDSIYGKAFFTHLVYDSTTYPGIPRLIDEGYLAKIQTLSGSTHIDVDGIPRTKADLNQQACGVKFHAIMPVAVADMRQKFDALNIKTAIVFVSNIANGEDVLEQWGDSNTMRLVTGKSSPGERKSAVHWLKSGHGQRILVNAEILTTGFNAPNLQAVVMLRATISLGLLVQIIGRLIRPYGDKIGTFIDYGSNVSRLLPGGLEKIEPPKPKLKKEEPQKKPCTFIAPGMAAECGHWNHLNAKACVKCGAFFSYGESEDGLYSMLSEAQVLQLERINSREEFEIIDVIFEKTLSKRGDEMLVAKYYYDGGHQKKYICFDTKGADAMAKAWLRDVLVDYVHYIELQQCGAISTENVYLLTQEAPEYFQKPKSIVIHNQKDSNKYKEIYKINY